MGLSATAPWLAYYGTTPATINYPHKTMFQLLSDAAKQYLKDNPDVADSLEAAIRRDFFKLMSAQSQVAARAAGRAVDVSADDFDDSDDDET